MTEVAKPDDPQHDDADTFVPDKIVAKEFGISAMSLWRWTNSPDMGFPPVIHISKRRYRSRRAIEEFKAKMIAKAIRAA